eukprot:CAMPEP_0194328220 /NCGR_PEP_ID=MMETSP0171-20130528/43912_1 /TAXON_ID=218684 /ORGANISM="Corethron pennatum, Strain L29A3" /LENGTH=214 /DNA_ID=CAMNT_0039088469 /DNA_START=24 /DNA_END=665 /DNA_ORIENTATION=-
MMSVTVASAPSRCKLRCAATLLPPSPSSALDLPIVWHLAFHPAGTYLAVCRGLSSANGTPYYDTTPDVVDRSSPATAVTSPSIDVYSAGKNDVGWLHALSLPTPSVHSRTVRCASFSSSGRWIAAAGFDGIVSIWSFPGAECVAALEGHESEVKSVCWRGDRTVATCGRDKTVWVWERFDDSDGGEPEFECVAVLSGHAGDVKTIVFASDGVLL